MYGHGILVMLLLTLVGMTRDLVGATVSKVLSQRGPISACNLPIRGTCAWAFKFGPVTFDLVAMTLTLGFLCMLLCPRY